MLGVVILAAGQGTRMRSPLPKVLHEAAGKPLLAHVLGAVAPLEPTQTVVIVGHEAEQVEARFADYRVHGHPLTFVRQDFSQGYGTGAALKQAEDALADFEGNIMVLSGDVPLVRTETLRALVQRQAAQAEGMTLLTCMMQDPYGMGRIIRAEDGSVVRIVEEKDLTPAEREIHEMNPALYVFDRHVFELAAELKDDNAAGEYYITDLVGLYLQARYPVQTVLGEDETEILGVNDQEQLAHVDRLLRARAEPGIP